MSSEKSGINLTILFLRYIGLIIFILLTTCCEKPTFDTSSKEPIEIDSIDVYLRLAGSDTLSDIDKKRFNNNAYQAILTASNDSMSRVNLFKVANRFFNIEAFENYKEVSFKALDRSVEANDTISEAKAYVYLGDYYKYKIAKDSAFTYYLKAEKIYAKIDDKVNLASVKINNAEILWNQNDYYASEAAALDALKLLRNTDDVQKTYEALVLLGIISNALKNYNDALLYLNRAFNIVENSPLQSPSPYATTLNNIGNVYQGAEKNDEAILNFEKALKEKNLDRENPLLYSVLLDNLAYSKFKKGEKGKQIVELFEESIRIKSGLNYLSGICFSKTRLGEYYYSIGQLDSAIYQTKEALKIAEESQNAILKLNPLKQLSSYDALNSQKYSDQYIRINDSVQLTERQLKDKFARIQFETDEISLQKDKLEEKNRTLLLFFVGTVMIGLLLFVIRTQRAKNRELMLKQAQQKANEEIYNLMIAQQNKIEEGRIREKKRIAQELHDGVLSRLFGARLNLDSLNKMDGGEATEKRNNYLTELKNIEQDIREISHDLNREKFVLINNFLAILTNLLEEQANNFETEVVTDIDDRIPWEKVSNNLKINIYRIVQEALQNVNKYAKATKIKVILREQDGTLKLEVTDNGEGFSVNKKSKGIGLSNMVSRTQECDGQLEIKSKKGKGTTICITFPTESKPDEGQQSSAEPAIA
ncbi:tetratricopeptide repeat-containing sensor histidine kinase [Flavobacterium selenitireducens]|uniref:tetratricopeptide repeat-containing sensor histidine kinase n=1 Tax=Flavobacterium selenitireducens TaxID=2722704 RepID=UPI00168AFE7F|nr:sensor histidine kinase [Flavobacterium selenitireducens]MBD3582141.1 sensor histidine kinase [Flavobacterium selenitireducens]